MSRIGKMPVVIPAGVTVDIQPGNVVTVKGPKGELKRELDHEMTLEQKDNEIIVTRPDDLKRHKALHGLTRALLHNMVVGVTDGFTKTLEINGVGYRAQKQGKKLVLSLGYSHPIEMEDPEGVESTEETGEETTEENAEGESDVAEETAETSEEEASDESAEADSAESE